jgi:hypothetical protein
MRLWKNGPKCSPIRFFVKINAQLLQGGKVAQIFVYGYTGSLYPIGENSPNLVTLLRIRTKQYGRHFYLVWSVFIKKFWHQIQTLAIMAGFEPLIKLSDLVRGGWFLKDFMKQVSIGRSAKERKHYLRPFFQINLKNCLFLEHKFH